MMELVMISSIVILSPFLYQYLKDKIDQKDKLPFNIKYDIQ